jgi:isoleucyl-tRNA synthetase
MKKIKKAENQPNFPQLEDKVTKFWKENSIFQKSVATKPETDPYVFVDGPPFVTGTPHYGSLLPSVAKDVIPRYWTMKGKRVRRVWGWDCHGLPVEEKVNKKFGILSSMQLEQEMGVDKYIQECRNWVNSCSNEWKWYIEKIGRWVDMDNAYYTMDTNFMESVIWGFKQIHEKGYIYKGKRVSLYSTDTSTPVSQFEVAMDASNYRDVEDLSIFVKFELNSESKDKIARLIGEAHQQNVLDDKPVYLVAWTTTPWTIPSNFALAVNPKVDYVLVEFSGEYLIVAKPRLEYTFNTTAENIPTENGKLVRVLSEFKGDILEGIRYKPVYDFFVESTTENDFKVYLYDGVNIEDGTGILHLAPAFGEEDFNLGKKHGITGISDIDEEGKMTVGEWKGIYLRDACDPIAQDLQKCGNLLRSEVYNHRLPFYRGDNPLIYMAQDSYFIDIQRLKEKLLKNAEDINWIPEHIKEGRWMQTIEGSPDWAISRNRYWATIMPIWKSEDGEEIVIGSIEEMTKYTDQIVKEGDKYLFEGKPMDLHRDVCDKIILKKDGKEFHRIPEVLDCWMDSGSVPFAEYHYPFENKDLFEKGFPSDYIIEYVGQVRAWFNVLHRISTLVFDKKAFTNVICTGVLAGSDGRKMSKSFGNYPDPKEVLEKIGGEALRLYLMSSAIMVGEDMNWSDEVLNDQVKNVLIPLWNTYKYLTIYADLHNWTPENVEFTSNNVLDKWLESYIKKQVLEYSKALEKYNIPESVKLIQPTIDNISAWFIRRSRDRFADGDKNALQTLYAALVTITKAFAPQMPFVTEEIYQNLVRDVIADTKESVHLEDFPMFDESEIDAHLLGEMEVVREVCTLGQSIRVQNALKVRQPLSQAWVAVEGENSDLRSELLEIVKEELNVKEVTFGKPETQSDKLHSNTTGNYTVFMNAEITPELKEEGLYAELKRQVQNLRKTSGLQMSELAKLELQITNDELRMIIEKKTDQLKIDTTLSTLELVDQIDDSVDLKIDDFVVKAKLVN